MKKQGKGGYKKRRGESYHKTEGGAQRGQNKKRWVRRRGRYNLITRQREGIRGDKTRIWGVKRGGEQIVSVYNKPS